LKGFRIKAGSQAKAKIFDSLFIALESFGGRLLKTIHPLHHFIG
jgi:hypothetical protein